MLQVSALVHPVAFLAAERGVGTSQVDGAAEERLHPGAGTGGGVVDDGSGAGRGVVLDQFFHRGSLRTGSLPPERPARAVGSVGTCFPRGDGVNGDASAPAAGQQQGAATQRRGQAQLQVTKPHVRRS